VIEIEFVRGSDEPCGRGAKPRGHAGAACEGGTDLGQYQDVATLGANGHAGEHHGPYPISTAQQQTIIVRADEPPAADVTPT